MDTVQYAVQWLRDSKVVDADTFGELLDHLQSVWTDHDQVVRQRREEGARALLHAEQRNLLAQKLAEQFERRRRPGRRPLRHRLPQGLVGPGGGRGAAVLHRRLRRPVRLPCRRRRPDLERAEDHRPARPGAPPGAAGPGLLGKLREGLQRMEYPPELSQRFFDSLETLHGAA
jgi:hypothetical protein